MTMRIYLDNCCFNRPYDDQSHLKIRLESEAKLGIQEKIRSSEYDLVWSYILDYENKKNPFLERKEQIAKWRSYAKEDVQEDETVLLVAKEIRGHGIKKMDALHLACAVRAQAVFFLTTDAGILKKALLIQNIIITDPLGFIKEVLQ
ncbi:MAG: hypothetical protein Q3M30_07090 [Candidatus Electrothrix sp. Rat3]|nr:hypothetical protein [Candidatus Electrothrix rattekaaiensis]